MSVPLVFCLVYGKAAPNKESLNFIIVRRLAKWMGLKKKKEVMEDEGKLLS
jgi:hypothetical protein